MFLEISDIYLISRYCNMWPVSFFAYSFTNLNITVKPFVARLPV